MSLVGDFLLAFSLVDSLLGVFFVVFFGSALAVDFA